ncbi:GNAT family N-acetyltransferase [Candidatus Uhrbacteria bacterium]|nr:GNAT family N-acetyltransferase [Candidatus Uhrbacteria bacterium]
MALFTIRDAVENDIPSINELFRGEYGEGYPYQMTTLSAPDMHLVAQSDGKIVGFARASPYGIYFDVWELCSLVVHSKMRQHGIARSFTIERIRRLREMGVKTLVSESVTCYSDCASQRNLMNFGFKPYGLLPFVHPWIRPEVLGDQPLTLLLMVRSLNGGTGFGTRELFLSDQDRLALEQFIPSKDLKPPWTSLLHFEGGIQSFFKPGKSVHGIRGSDFVDISLNHPSALETRRQLHAEGYRFAGILPGFGRDEEGQHVDLLRLYRPVTHTYTFDLVYVTPDLEALKQYCTRDFNAS